MTTFIKKYWAELLVFGAIFAVLMIDLIPDITWINTDCDGPHYIYSAKYLYPAHKTSAPLFLLLGHLFLMIPIATEAWRFALLSALASMGTCIFIYLSIKHHTNNRWYAIIGILVFGSSALVISQSTIIESYALTTMLGMGAYYFSIKKRWWLCAIFLGAGLAVHTLGIIPIIIILIANKEFRCYEYCGIIFLFLLFYLYIPITNKPPYMWQSPNNSLGTSFITDNLSTLLMLFGGLSIWDLPKRIFDAIGILGISLTIAVIPLSIALKKWKQPLFWLFVLPIAFYVTNLAPQTYVYMMPSIAAGAILAGIGLKELQKHPTWISHGFNGILAITLIGMLAFNCVYFNVGKTLDPNLSAREFWNKELPKIPDGQILLAQQGWEWAIVYPYNKDTNKNIIPVCIGTLASKQYQNTLHEMGVKFDIPEEELNLIQLQNFILQSITQNNKNVWITLPTDTSTYGAKVARIEGHEEELTKTPKSIDIDVVPIQWKPSNPYDIITGAIEVDEWTYIVFSNYSVLTFVMLGTIGLVPVWILYMIIAKKKKWSFNTAKRRLIDEV